jgi:hypothetical protein
LNGDHGRMVEQQCVASIGPPQPGQTNPWAQASSSAKRSRNSIMCGTSVIRGQSCWLSALSRVPACGFYILCSWTHTDAHDAQRFARRHRRLDQRSLCVSQIICVTATDCLTQPACHNFEITQFSFRHPPGFPLQTPFLYFGQSGSNIPL